MRRTVAILLAIPLALLTYAFLAVTDRVASNAPGTCYGNECTSTDGAIVLVAWWFLILAWCLVVWMFRGRKRHA